MRNFQQLSITNQDREGRKLSQPGSSNLLGREQLGLHLCIKSLQGKMYNQLHHQHLSQHTQSHPDKGTGQDTRYLEDRSDSQHSLKEIRGLKKGMLFQEDTRYSLC